MRQTVLVAGGAGYIGSHMVKMLARHGYGTITVDNLATGHRDSVISGDFIAGDLTEPREIARVFSENVVDVVMHFAACWDVGESVTHPRKYYRNNVLGTLNLLDAMLDAGVKKIVFSSTCSTYGVPETESISESHPQRPVNPYGRTKLAVEQVLADYAHAYGLHSVSLRYFNAAGCDPEGELGERHDPETHLIPLVLREALRVRDGGDPAATGLEVFGADFDTPDGTCIRDYVHVSDLCTAHLLALRRLLQPGGDTFEAFNLGTGRGHSVKEVIEACRRVTGQDIRYRVAGRRPGDPARLVASAERARSELAWSPKYIDLAEIVGTAWRWFSRQSVGAGSGPAGLA